MDKLYLSVDEAAECVGVGEKAMRQFANSADPPHYLAIGREKRLQKAALEGYFYAKQDVK